MTVPEIVEKVFADHPMANFDLGKLFRSYRKWVYCVQYNESDFNFVSRLLEHEGIYWYFLHGDDGKGRMILADSQAVHDPAPGYEKLPYYEEASQAPPDIECVSRWHCTSQVKTDKVVFTSYDFERPSTRLNVDAKKAPTYESPSPLEAFDYQGDYVQLTDGAQWVEDQLDEHQATQRHAAGASNAHGIEVGRLMTLTKHPRADQNSEYLVTEAQVHAAIDGSESGGGTGRFRCDFKVVPSGQQFRPARTVPKQHMRGPQTAVVVGPAGEEIYTDRYGRVKVQFHWDREGLRNEKSSCWVRVSSPWAGKNFGAVHVPRIGQEVVVSFLEGDPDQPLITGRVYNAEQMPPWDLPEHATQSGILSRSSKGGAYGNANAIRFEDKKGAEQLWLHAERDQLIEVENDEAHTVGRDRHKSVARDQTITIGRDEKTDIKGNRTVDVTEGRQDNTVKSNITMTSVDGSISITASQQIELKVGSSVITITDGAIRITGPNRVDINP